MDISNNFMGLGYGGSSYRHDTGGSSSAGAVMQQHHVNQQTGENSIHNGAAASRSFVRPQYASREAYMQQDQPSRPSRWDRSGEKKTERRKSRWGPQNPAGSASTRPIAAASLAPASAPSTPYNPTTGMPHAPAPPPYYASEIPPTGYGAAPSPYNTSATGHPNAQTPTTAPLPSYHTREGPPGHGVASSAYNIATGHPQTPIFTHTSSPHHSSGGPPAPSHNITTGNTHGQIPTATSTYNPNATLGHLHAPRSTIDPTGTPYHAPAQAHHPHQASGSHITTHQGPALSHHGASPHHGSYSAPLPGIPPPHDSATLQQQPPHNSKSSTPNNSRFAPSPSPFPDVYDRTGISSFIPPAPPPLPFPALLKPSKPKVEMNDLSRAAQMARSRAIGVINQLKDQAEEDIMTLEKAELGRKRRVCLEKLKQKHNIALLKNLEYVARVEDQRLQEQLQRVQEVEVYHTQLEDFHSQLLEIRSKTTASSFNKNKNSIQQSQAGIGTESRQRVERKRKKQTGANDSVAIYVSNLPTNGSASDELMRALFSSYGNIRKLHFYIDKQTGDLKGDALVIYNIEDATDKSNLTDAVCSQMNGAELPCGTTIKVEPSDPLYQLRKKKQMNYYGAASNESAQDEIPAEAAGDVPQNIAKEDETQAGGGDDDDLDDFFASLT